jgi:hypothetical protein
VIFFGPPRALLFFVVLFFLVPVFLYSPGFALVVGGIVLLASLALAGGRRRTTGRDARVVERPARPFADVRAAAQDDLLALADDIRALDVDIELAAAGSGAKRHYERALDRYEIAREAFDGARSPEDFEPVSHAVEQGRFEIATAKALLEGREPPERRPPCFFDPRHGPSVRDVSWAPPRGTPRPVPACAADAIRIEEGEEPDSRRVPVGDRSLPYWEAPAYYGPWAGGYFGGFGTGGLLSGLLVGSVLGAGITVLDPFESGGLASDRSESFDGLDGFDGFDG